MIIKLDVDSDQYSEIEKLVKEGKYQDIIQFIKISIANQIQEEKSGNDEPIKLEKLSAISGRITFKAD